MKLAALLIAAAVSLAGLSILYLATAGLPDEIHASSTAAVATFSNAAAAQRSASVSGEFGISPDIRASFRGLCQASDLEANQLVLKINVDGKMRWRLFHDNRPEVCSAANFDQLLRDELVRLTGDSGVQVQADVPGVCK